MASDTYLADVVLSGVAMEAWTCGQCGATSAFTEVFMGERREDKRSFYCPNGHSKSFTGTPALTEARRELAAAQRREQATRELLDHEQARRQEEARSHRATRGHLTRQKRRTAAGVCPVKGCKRHFKNLEAHMRTKHPSAVKAARTQAH